MLNSSPLAAGDEVIKLDRPRLDMANNLITDFKVEDLKTQIGFVNFYEHKRKIIHILRIYENE